MMSLAELLLAVALGVGAYLAMLAVIIARCRRGQDGSASTDPGRRRHADGGQLPSASGVGTHI